MSATMAATANDRAKQCRSAGRPRGLLNWRVTRFVLGVGLAAGMATVLPIASISAASATPVAAGHHVGGGGGKGGRVLGGGSSHGHGRSDHVSVSGTVASVNSAGFDLTVAEPEHMLTSTSTTVDVSVTSGTLYREPGQSAPGLAAVLVGDNVGVTGTPAGPGSITALQVVVPLTTDAGTVATTTSNGFTLTVLGGWATLTETSTTVDVTVTGTTVYRVPGQSSPGLSDVLVGDKLEVAGPPQGKGALTALVVVVPLATDAGTVSSPASGGFTLTTEKGTTVTVDVSPATRYRARGVVSPGLANVLSGDTVAVTGTQAGSGTVDALLVVISSAGRGHHGQGNNGGGQKGHGHHGRR